MIRIQSPTGDDSMIEQELVSKGLTAPRVTIQMVEDNISSEHYFTAAEGASAGEVDIHHPGPPMAGAPLSLLTFCVLVLRNGFTVTGESACASPENYDAEIGRKIARVNAVNKIWPLMGYVLKEQLSRQEK